MSTSDKPGYVNFYAVLAAACCVLGAAPGLATPSHPSLVFLLLDTTRADRLGAWGNPAAPTPHLDALAASGVRFGRHFANAHATRSSMPQLLTGRYFHASVLRSFRSADHPREFPFLRADPSARLLTATLHDAGYATVGASAHPWVVEESPFGATFDRLDFLSSPVAHGHARAAAVVDRGIELWRARPADRPIVLYLHFMDTHVPRRALPGATEEPLPGYGAPERFGKDGEPRFGRERRRWRRSDARDFSADDRRFFRARYDGLLAYLDGEIGRLLRELRADDPELDDTLVVVVADHGENLGEEGLIDHADGLTDGVQHVPWIVAGAGVPPGQKTERFTENVDVVPTVLRLLGTPLPADIRTDGVAQIGADGTLCHACAKRAVYYAWEDYVGVRTRRHLLRRQLPGSPRAHCGAAEQLFTMGTGERTLLPAGAAPATKLGQLLRNRLTPLDRAFRATRYGTPETPFILRPDFWVLPGAPIPACTEMGVETTAASLDRPGWLFTGRGVTVLDGEPDAPLRAVVGVPDGPYAVDAAVVSIDPMPLFFAFDAWLERFRVLEPTRWVPVGDVRVHDGFVEVPVPPQAGTSGHVVGMRFSPTGRPAAGTEPATTEDAELRERLRVLGYVE